MKIFLVRALIVLGRALAVAYFVFRIVETLVDRAFTRISVNRIAVSAITVACCVMFFLYIPKAPVLVLVAILYAMLQFYRGQWLGYQIGFKSGHKHAMTQILAEQVNSLFAELFNNVE